MFVRILAVASLALVASQGVAHATSTASAGGTVTLTFTSVPADVELGLSPSLAGPEDFLTLTLGGGAIGGGATGPFVSSTANTDSISLAFNISASGNDPFDEAAIFADFTVPPFDLFFSADGFSDFTLGFTLDYDFTLETVRDPAAGIPSARIDSLGLGVDGGVLSIVSGGFPSLGLQGASGSRTEKGQVTGTISVPDVGGFAFLTGQFVLSASAEVAPVPLPAGAWFLVGALGALGMAVRRRRSGA